MLGPMLSELFVESLLAFPNAFILTEAMGLAATLQSSVRIRIRLKASWW